MTADQTEFKAWLRESLLKLYGEPPEQQDPAKKMLVKKGATMDVDIPKLVRTIARKTGMSRKQVEEAFRQTVAEHTGAATKAENLTPGLNLRPVAPSNHASVRLVDNMTGATTKRQRLKASGRDAFGRNMGETNHPKTERGIHGERLN